MKRIIVLALPLFLVPLLANATGFPQNSVWLSKVAPAAGDTIQISAVVHNTGTSAVQGTVAFLANEKTIGTASFSLESGAAGIVSVPWTVEPGEYSLSARIDGGSDIDRATSGTLAVSVAEPPKPAPLEESVQTANDLFASFASSSLPMLGNAGQAVFAKTEALRESGVEALESYLAGKQKEPAETSAAAAEESATETEEKAAEEKESMWSKASQAAAAGALFTFKNAALFYPLLAFAILFFLYLLAKRLSGRSYRN